MSKHLIRGCLGWVAVGLAALVLSGCGGGSGDAGPQGTPGAPGAQGPTGPAGPAGTGSVNVAVISPEAWASTKFTAAVTRVTIASPPVVEFTLADNAGNAVVGLERITSTGDGRGGTFSNGVKRYPNLEFALAKLVPRDDSNPSEWKSYVVTTVPLIAASAACPASQACPTRPSTDNSGTLEAIAGSPGSYRYTFFRDVPGIKAAVAAMAASAAAASPNNRVADLGDLTYAPTLPHRLVIQIGGAAPGTGSNTANGVTVTPAVNAANPVNVIYDFIPGTGAALTAAQLTREDVNIDSCNVCHGKLAFHGGSARVETRYCVVCHTEQRAYGQARATSTAGSFPALTESKTVDAATGITSYSYAPNTYVADGEVAGNFTTMIHKIHNGRELVKENYNYANLVFNNKGFSKLGGGQRMCTTCHDSKIATTADNHKALPSRVSCGACHDGINFATGGGSTLADKAATAYGAPLATSGHIGRDQADDSKCALCHTPANVPIDHRMENLTKNNKYVLPGLATFTYQIDSAAVNASSNDVTIRFRILQQVADSTGSVTNVAPTPVTLLAPAVGLANPLAGFSGSPGFLLAYALPQDGITAPVDFNNRGIKQAQPISVSIASLLNTATTATSANTTTVGSLAGPDGSGYYTATLRGNGSAVCGGSTTLVPCVFPVGARLRTVALQGYFTQLNAPTTPQGGVGAVARHAISVLKTVAGDTPRRTVVAADKCAGCHEWFEGHGGNRVYETQVCVMCHNPGLASSGRGISDATLAAYNTAVAPGTFTLDDNRTLTEWGFNKTLPNAALRLPVTSNNFKDMIHGIHAGRERVTPFQDARDRTPSAITLLDFRRMDFPGKLNNCETCHVTSSTTEQKTYDYVPAGTLVTTYESVDAAYAAAAASAAATPALAKTALNTSNATDIVTTPFAAACVSCHDNTPAKAHISINGGAINLTRTAAQPTPRALEDIESCAVCHGPGRDFDTAKVHNK
jgi:OmcA/MtrC family decaheme c-type cytochrome